ncbi:MAG TPA: clostripain-related cysteine peptidase, partial [Candidatus Bathyarchaeia archaeon]|nr:clostripain-related cysteine peptidase [Candidatus Bathyarchaeia archaeon]
MSLIKNNITNRSNLRVFLPLLLLTIIFSQGILLINPNQNSIFITTTTPVETSGFETNDLSYDWLVLNYFDGDNNLEEDAIVDVNELEDGFDDLSSIKILALLDRTPGYDTSDGDWTGTRLYDISHDTNTGIISSTLIKDFGELNMGAGSSLEILLDFGLNNYSIQSTNIWLNIWDHGGGIDGICWDDTSYGDCLYIDEMQTAIANQETEYSRKLDLITHDACLMDMIEVAYELKDLADYYVG